MKRSPWRWLAAALLLLAAYLLAWPVPIDPPAWRAPPAPARAGVFAPNDRLRAVERIGRGEVDGPEATAIDAAGRVYTGARDGRILRLEPGSHTFQLHARTGGRPLGMAVTAGGGLVVADAEKGLLSVSAAGEVRVLALDRDSGRGLQLHSPRLALGDLVLRTQLLAAEGGASPREPDRSRWGLSARLDAKLPLGRPERLGGSGNWDVGAALLGTFEAAPGLTFHALAALALVSPLPASIPLQVRPLRPFAELSMALRLGSWTLLLEDRLSGPILRRLAPSPDAPPSLVEASAYYGLALAQNRVGLGLRRGALTLWFSEDFTPGAAPRAAGPVNWFHNSNAPDVAMGLVWTRELGN